MADREVVGIELVAKLDQLRSEFKSLPKTTDDETKKAVSLALKNLTRLEKGAAKSAKAASDSIGGKAGDGIKAFGEKAGDADTALKALAGAVGLVSPAAGAALSSIGDLAGGVEGASKATALLGVAGTAAAVGVVAIGASVAAFGAAAVGAVSASLDLAQGWKEIQGLGGLDSFKITSEQQSSLERGEAALTSIKLAGEAVVVAFASQVAPTVEKAAVGFTFLALGAGKIVSSFGEAGGVASDLGTVLRGYLVGAFDAVAGGVARAIEGLAYLYDATGFDDLAASMRRGAEALRAYSSELDAKATEAQAAALSRLGVAARETYEETTALVGISRAHNRATRNAKDAAEAAKAAEEERRASLAALTADLKRVGDEQRAATKATEDAAKATSTLLEKSEAFGAEAPTAIEKTRAEYQALDRELLQQIETNLKVGASTEALESERVELAKRTKAELERLRQEESADQEETRQEALELDRAAFEAKVGTAAEVASQVNAALSAGADFFLEKWTSALDATTTQLDKVRGALDEFSAQSVNAATLTGHALVEAFTSGEVALDELSAAQQADLKTRLQAEEAFLAQKAKVERDAALKAFKVSKGTATSEAIINGAVAATAALRLGPIAGPIAAGAIAGLVAIQVGTIAAQEPAFHSGGIVGQSSPGYAPDERSYRLQTGEAVLSRVGRAVVGDETIRQANRGKGSSPVVQVTQTYDGRVIGQVVQDQVKSSSTLRRALATGRPGHRSR